MQRTATLVVLLIACTGCWPVRDTYYKPLGGDGYLYRGACATLDRNLYKNLNEEVTVSISPRTDDQILEGVKVSFYIYPGSKLEFIDNSLELVSENYNYSTALGTMDSLVWNDKTRDLEFVLQEPENEMIGFPAPEGSYGSWSSEFQKWGGFHFISGFPSFAGESLVIHLPMLALNGEALDPINITIQKVTETNIQTLCQ